MIRVVMLGRLGNNLFQYAMGRVLAERHGVPLLMDGGRFNRRDWAMVRQLERLDIRAKIRRGPSILTRAMHRLAGRHPWEFRGWPVVREREGFSGFDPAVMKAPGDAVLMGYFQSPRYFEGMEAELRDELDLSRLPWSKPSLLKAAEMNDPSVVAVHVRRTDYVGSNVFDLCGPGYYRRAMTLMRERQEGLRFVMFSDDPDWCRRTFADDGVEVCSLREANGDPLHDLFLMSCAGHHIIANSSYSWWAAWLGKKPGQRVIVPSTWFGASMQAPIEDKILRDWKTLE